MSRVVPGEATVTGWRRDGATGIITMPDGSIMCAVDPDRPRPPGINERTSSVAPGGRDWPHPGQLFRTVELEPERPRILQKGEVSALLVVVGTCWAFIFVGGYIEWTHGGLNRCDELCKECGSDSSFGSGSCTECMPGKVCCSRKARTAGKRRISLGAARSRRSSTAVARATRARRTCRPSGRRRGWGGASTLRSS